MTKNFNPRSPYGERHQNTDYPFYSYQFQSTLPLRGATISSISFNSKEGISIHAPLTGSDSALSEYRRVMLYFNPRSPYGERLQSNDRHRLSWGFQSTLPLRGATTASNPVINGLKFQSTLPLRGATHRPMMPNGDKEFQSTLPLRGATNRPKMPIQPPRFQSTLPLRGATKSYRLFLDHGSISIHAPLTGSDPSRNCHN